MASKNKTPKGMIQMSRVYTLDQIDEITKINDLSITLDESDGTLALGVGEDGDSFGTFYPVPKRKLQYTFELHYP